MLSTSVSQFQVAVATLALAYEAMVLLDQRCRESKLALTDVQRQDMKDTITRMRGTVKRSSRALSKSANVCYSALLMQVTAIEVTELALPDKQAGMKMAKAGLKMALGAIKLAVTMTPNKELLEGIQSAGKLGLEAYRRKHAAVLASQLGCMATLTAYFRQQPVTSDHGAFKETIRARYAIIDGPEASVIRWEGVASFCCMLAEIMLSVGTPAHESESTAADGSATLSEELLLWLWEGDVEGLSQRQQLKAAHSGDIPEENEPHSAYHFGGLSRMLSFGEEKPEVNSPLYALAMWASEITTTDLQDWLKTGLRNFLYQCEEQCISRLKKFVQELERRQAQVLKPTTSDDIAKSAGTAVDVLEKISCCLKAPLSFLRHGKGILENFATLNAASFLKAKFLKVVRYPLDLLQQFLQKRLVNCEKTFEDCVLKFIEAEEDAVDNAARRVVAARSAIRSFVDDLRSNMRRLGVVLSDANCAQFKMLGDECVTNRLLDHDVWREFLSSFEEILKDLKEVEAALKTLACGLEDSSLEKDPGAFVHRVQEMIQELELDAKIEKKIEKLRSEVDLKVNDLVDKIMEKAEKNEIWKEIMTVQDIVAQVASLVGDLEECLKASSGKVEGLVRALQTNSAPISTARNSIVNATPTKAAATRPTRKKTKARPVANLTAEQLSQVRKISENLQALLEVEPVHFNADLSKCQDVIKQMTAGAKGAMDRAFQQLTDAAHDELEALANEAAGLVEGVIGDFDLDELDATGVAGFMQSIGSMANERMAERKAKREQWRARSIAILSARRVAVGVQGIVKNRILAALTRRQIAESNKGCLEIFKADQSLPVGLNAALTVNESAEMSSKPDRKDADAVQSYMMDQMDKQMQMLMQLAGSNSSGGQLSVDAALAGSKLSSDEDDDTTAARDAWLQNEADVADDVQGRIDAVSSAFEVAEKESDPLEKQAQLVLCRKQQQALKQSAETCSAISEKHGVEVEFLEGMQAQLANMDAKLDNLQKDVTAIREDLKRLVGRPVLEVYEEWRERQLAKSRRLQSGVYIESEVVKAGPQVIFFIMVISLVWVSLTIFSFNFFCSEQLQGG